MTSDHEAGRNAGAATDQHISSSDETETFPTDEPPKLTPAHRSSNLGINKLKANREDRADFLEDET